MERGVECVGETAAIILAAGKSTRMKSELPKVLHEVCGRPMLSFVLGACRLAGVDRILVVVGHGQELVRGKFEAETGVTWVEQTQQKGTGHAVLCCRSALDGFVGNVMVIAGDMPLVRRETLAQLIEEREQSGDALTLATTILEEPAGYGRIIRAADGSIESIVEHRDCTDEQRAIHEVNPSYYCFDASSMWTCLDQVKPDKTKGEIYVTDAVRVFRGRGQTVSAIACVPSEDATGINSRLDLTLVGRLMEDRIQYALMEEGVSIVDPETTWIEADVTIGRDTTIQPFSFVGAGSRIGDRCRIGPFAHVASDTTVADDRYVGPDSAGVACVGVGAS
mgnify:CR=1 FL=1